MEYADITSQHNFPISKTVLPFPVFSSLESTPPNRYVSCETLIPFLYMYNVSCD